MREKYLFIVFLFLFLIVSCEKERKTIGKQIDGDFNGDDKIETATITKVKTKLFNNQELIEYHIVFSDSTIKPMTLECPFKKIQLINEGDLNNDNADDISISYELSPDTLVSQMYTRSFNNFEWNDIIGVFSINVGSDTLSSEKLQNIVTKKNKSIIYYTYGEYFEFDKNFKPINSKKTRKEIKLK
jgi:hypothetical protein